MRFLVISDLHQKRSAVEWINRVIHEKGAEFVMFLGDVTDFGTVEDARKIVSAIDSKVYVIPGNCDPRDLPDGISDVAVDLHGKAVEIGGYRFVGLGGSNITIFGTIFELTEEELYDGLKRNASEKMVLVTHAPAYGTLDHIPSGASVGSPAVMRIVEEYHPILALSGHIHEDVGTFEKNGTVFLNPGPAKEGRCAIVDLDGEEVKVTLLGPKDV
ncbi:MAG: metallophosphoesterase family protein [Candidatus Methanomethylophilaceae archaeon]|nr:metallophosphoesterase family protein [Candidatus Methanomethylophilaceae archaeon]